MSEVIPPLSVPTLLQLLRPVTSWHALGVKLDIPAQQLDDVARSLSHEGSERCKAEIFELWLRRLPDVGWEDMVDALEKTSHHKLAGELRKVLKLQPAAVVNCSSPSDLQEMFSVLVEAVKRLLEEGEVKIKSVLRCLKKNLNVRLSHTPSDMEELFHTVAPYFSPFNPYLLACLVQKFSTMHRAVQDRLEQYNQCLDKFCLDTTMKQLAEFTVQSQSSLDLGKLGNKWSKATVVMLEVASCWLPVSIDEFHLLVSGIFLRNEKLFNHMTVKCCHNSLLVSWFVPESSVKLLCSLTRERLQMMKLIGISHLAIHDTIIMHYNSNNLTDFDMGLIEAVRAMDKEAINLLLKLGADPSQPDKQGNTALAISRRTESCDSILQLLGGRSLKGKRDNCCQQCEKYMLPLCTGLVSS